MLWIDPADIDLMQAGLAELAIGAANISTIVNAARRGELGPENVLLSGNPSQGKTHLVAQLTALEADRQATRLAWERVQSRLQPIHDFNDALALLGGIRVPLAVRLPNLQMPRVVGTGGIVGPAVTAPATRTLSDWLPGFSDDALIHLSDARADQLKPGVFADSY